MPDLSGFQVVPSGTPTTGFSGNAIATPYGTVLIPQRGDSEALRIDTRGAISVLLQRGILTGEQGFQATVAAGTSQYSPAIESDVFTRGPVVVNAQTGEVRQAPQTVTKQDALGSLIPFVPQQASILNPSGKSVLTKIQENPEMIKPAAKPDFSSFVPKSQMVFSDTKSMLTKEPIAPYKPASFGVDWRAREGLAGLSPEEQQKKVTEKAAKLKVEAIGLMVQSDIANKRILAGNKIIEGLNIEYAKEGAVQNVGLEKRALFLQETGKARMGELKGKIEGLNAEVYSLNKAQEEYPEMLKPEDFKSKGIVEGLYDVTVLPAAKTTSSLLDVGAGLTSATLTASAIGYANVANPLLGKQKVPYDLEKAYETGVGSRRAITYGAAMLPIVGEAIAPLAIATALSDVGEKPNIPNIVIAGTYVAGLGAVGNLPKVGAFLGAGTKTMKALTTVSKAVTTGEKTIVRPLLTAAGEIYLEESTFGGIQKAIGLKPKTILGEVEEGRYESARALSLEQGSQFGSFVVGGMAAQTALSGFYVKPTLKTIFSKETAPERTPAGGFAQRNKTIVGSIMSVGSGTVSPRYKVPFTDVSFRLPGKTLPASYSGQQVTTSTFTSPTEFTQKVISKGEFEWAQGTVPIKPTYMYGKFQIVSSGEKTVDSQIEFPGKNMRFKNPAISDVVNTKYAVKEFSSKSGMALTGSEKTGFEFKETSVPDVVTGYYKTLSGKKMFIYKEDVLPSMVRYSKTYSVQNKPFAESYYEEGLLTSRITAGKKPIIERPSRFVDAFRVSRTKGLLTEDLSLESGGGSAGEGSGYTGGGIFSSSGGINIGRGVGGTKSITQTQQSLQISSGMERATKMDVSGVSATVSGARVAPMVQQQAFSSAGLSYGVAQQERTSVRTLPVSQQRQLSVARTQTLAVPATKTISSSISKTETKAITMPQTITRTWTDAITATKTGTIMAPATKIDSATLTVPKIVSVTAPRTITTTRMTTSTKMADIGPLLPFNKLPWVPPVIPGGGGESKGFAVGAGLGVLGKNIGLKVPKMKFLVQSSPFRRLLGTESNVLTTKKSLVSYSKYIGKVGYALASYPTAEEFRFLKGKKSKKTKRVR